VFDTFTGLPTHILVSHFAVVLIPIGATATIAVVLRKAWREKFAGLLALGNIGLLAMAFVTLRAGEDLMDRYRELGDEQTPKFDHESLGRTLVWIMLATTVASLLVWAVQPMRTKAPAAVLGLAAVVVALSVTTLVYSYLAGHTGSESHWKEFIENSNDQRRESAAP
jgi:membrane protein required for beta-lactamase induction